MFFKLIKNFGENFKYCTLLSWRASRYYTIVRIVSRIMQAFVSMLAVFMSKEVINFLASSSNNDGINKTINIFYLENEKYALIILLIILMGLGIFTKLIENVNSYCSGIHNDMLNNYINLFILEKAILADISHYDSPKFHDSFDAIQRDSFALVNIVWLAIDGIGAFISLLSAFLILSTFNPFFGILMVVATIPNTIMEQKYAKVIYHWGLDYIRHERKMNYIRHIGANKEYAMEIRLFNIGSMLKKKYIDVWDTYFSEKRIVSKKRSIVLTLCSFLPEFCIVIMLINISFGILMGENTVGDYTLYVGMLNQLMLNMFLIAHVISNLYENRLKIENIEKFEKMQIQTMANGNCLITEPPDIKFDNVSFCYPNTDKMVLKNISFEIGKLEKVCVVGLNGAGKSTMIKLLLRFYEPTEGNILINGINIKDYEIGNLRRNFSCFFQDAVKFAFTVKENITISDLGRNSSDEEIISAAYKSGFSDALPHIKNNLEGYISREFEEDGVELSGGQNQRLALARTFYRKCSIILLDEPTAFLDPEAEHRLFEELKDICKDKTTIFTSHRLSNISLADRIIVVENGMIIEQGTHKELLENPGRYAVLYKYQADKYKMADKV